MILSCPSCETRFVIGAAAFGEVARTVRCAKCGNSWHQEPVAEEEEAPAPAPAPVAEIAADAGIPAREPENDKGAAATGAAGNAAADTDRPGDADGDIGPESAAEAEAEEPAAGADDGGRRSRRARARAGRAAEGPAGEGGSKSSRTGWLILIFVLLGIGGAGFIFQNKVVEIWPPAGQLYEMVGLGSGPEEFGLAIQNVNWEHKRKKGQPVLEVLGEVKNTSSKPQSVPRLRVEIRDGSDRRLFRWTVTTAKNSLEAGQITKFSTRLANPPEGARSLVVTFQVRP